MSICTASGDWASTCLSKFCSACPECAATTTMAAAIITAGPKTVSRCLITCAANEHARKTGPDHSKWLVATLCSDSVQDLQFTPTSRKIFFPGLQETQATCLFPVIPCATFFNIYDAESGDLLDQNKLQADLDTEKEAPPQHSRSYFRLIKWSRTKAPAALKSLKMVSSHAIGLTARDKYFHNLSWYIQRHLSTTMRHG